MRLISNLTHDSFARMIGSVRAVVNRHMQIWKKQGILDLKQKKIIIKDLEALKNAFRKPYSSDFLIKKSAETECRNHPNKPFRVSFHLGHLLGMAIFAGAIKIAAFTRIRYSKWPLFH